MKHQQRKLSSPLAPTILIQHPALTLKQDKYSLGPSPSINPTLQNKDLTNKQMQTFVKQMRFREKMQLINSKKEKYKRSTNNCHKKYIGILKNLIFLKLSHEIKDYILSEYKQYRNSRVYYFINLCYLKWCLDLTDIAWVFQHFCQEVQNKISRYKLEISMTDNENFINFRKDQIVEMEYAIVAINHFLRGATQESIRVLYQKNKYIIIKKNQYTRSLDLVIKIDCQLEREYAHINMATKLSQLDLQSYYRYNANAQFSKPLQKQHKQSLSYKQQSQSMSQQSQLEIRHKQDRMGVKIQQEQPQLEQKYPLIGLQNSYQLISQLKWHSWLIQKQKMLEFVMRTREQKIIEHFSMYNRINTEGYQKH